MTDLVDKRAKMTTRTPFKTERVEMFALADASLQEPEAAQQVESNSTTVLFI